MYRRAEIGQVARALRVLDALRGFKQGRWISEIASELDTSERTVRRDINELQDAGFDIVVTRRDNRSFAVLATERNYSPVSITKRERFTLLAVRNVFDVMQGTPFLDDVRSVMQKLEQRMSDKERAELAAFGENFSYLPDHGMKSYEGKDDIIDAIQTGILSRKVVRYRYSDGRGRPREGFVAPFGMVLYRHGLYVLGARLEHAKADPATSPLGNFAIERFTDAEHLRDHEFVVPADFDIRDHMHGAFGPLLADATGPHDIVVEFSSARAMYASSRTWHPAQHVERLSNGRVRISFRIPALAPVISWVLEWGPHARAIAPEALVKQVAKESGETHEQYPSSVS